MFSDPDVGDTHAASHWQMTMKAGDFGSPIFDNAHEAGSSLTSIAVTPCTLNPDTTYYWRVRYQDNRGAWSEWSEEASFTTQGTPPDNPPATTENHPPDRPLCVAPEDGATNVSTTPTLESSAFHDPDIGDSQAASQWQITTTSSDYQEPTVDRLDSLTSIIFPDETLSPETTYYWRVRHQDSHGTWSDWSEESSFTTRAEEASGTANRTNAASWIYLGAIVAVAVLAISVVAWRNARAAATATQ
jgi:chitodextrinase